MLSQQGACAPCDAASANSAEENIARQKLVAAQARWIYQWVSMHLTDPVLAGQSLLDEPSLLKQKASQQQLPVALPTGSALQWAL